MNQLDTHVYLKVALRCLASRPSLFAVILLITNDHLLKDLYPSWITGKLSDFAGLYFAPYLFLLAALLAVWLSQVMVVTAGRCVLPQQASNALAVSVFLFTGTLFAALKLSPVTAQPALALIDMITGQTNLVVTDPSDLLALVMLPIAYLGWKREVASSAPSSVASPLKRFKGGMSVRLIFQLSLLAIAGLAVMATSPAVKQGLMAIAIHPQFPWVVYAVGGTGFRSNEEPTPISVYRSTNRADFWEEIGGRYESQRPIESIETAEFYLGRPDGVWRFGEGNPALRRIWAPDGGEQLQVSSMTISFPVEVPSWTTGLIYVGVRGAVIRSSDAGKSWMRLPLPGPPESQVTSLAAAESEAGLLFALSESRLLRSQDWGVTWTTLADLGTRLLVIKVHPARPALTLAGDSNSLYRSDDSGFSWRRVWRAEAVMAPVSAIAFDHESQQRVYAAVRSHGLLISEDEGRSWRDALKTDARDVTVGRPPNQRVFVAAGEDGVYRQREGLRWPWLSDWEPVNKGIQSPLPSSFADQAVNLGSWLALVTGLLFVLRGGAPQKVRKIIVDHPWEVALALWTLLPSIVLVHGLVSRFDPYETVKLATLATPGALLTILRSRLVWVTWCLAILPTILICALVLIANKASTGVGRSFALGVRVFSRDGKTTC